MIFISAMLILSSCVHVKTPDMYFIDADGKNAEQALEIYQEGARNTHDMLLYYDEAYTFLELGLYENAIETADEALRYYPYSLRFEYLKAYALREMGKFRSYSEQLSHILSIDPGNEMIRNLLTEYYWDNGYDNFVMENALESVRRNPDNREAISYLATYIPFYESIYPAKTHTVTDENISQKPELYMMKSVMNGGPYYIGDRKIPSPDVEEEITQSEDSSSVS